MPVALALLQGRDGTLIHRIAADPIEFFPPGRRAEHFFGTMDAQAAFGAGGVGDLARLSATLFLEEVLDSVKAEVDPRFELARYGEKLAASAPIFDPLLQASSSVRPTVIEELLDEWIVELVRTMPGWESQPPAGGISVRFQHVYAGLRIAQKYLRDVTAKQRIRQDRPRDWDPHFDYFT